MDLNSTITRGRHNRPLFAKLQTSGSTIDDSSKKIETVTQLKSPEILHEDEDAGAKASAKSQSRSSPPFLPSKSLGHTSTNPLRRSVIFSLLAYDINANSEVMLNSSAVSDGSTGSEVEANHKVVNEDEVDVLKSTFTSSFAENNHHDDTEELRGRRGGGREGERRLSDSGNHLSRSLSMMTESMSSPAAPYMSPQTVLMVDKKKKKTKKNTIEPSLSSRLRMLNWESVSGEGRRFDDRATFDGKRDDDDDQERGDKEEEEEQEQMEEQKEKGYNVKILGLSSDSSDSSGFAGFDVETPLASSKSVLFSESEVIAKVSLSSVVDAPSPINPTEVRRFASVRDRLHAVNPLRTTSTALVNCASSKSTNDEKPPLPPSTLSSTRRPSLTSPGSPPRLNRPKGESGAGSINSTHSAVLGVRSAPVYAPQLAHSSPLVEHLSLSVAASKGQVNNDDLTLAYENAFRVSVRSTLARSSMDTDVCSSWTRTSSSLSPERRNSSTSPSISSTSSKSRRFSLPLGSGWNAEATLAAAELVQSVFSPSRSQTTQKVNDESKTASNLSLVAERVIKENLESKDELKRFIQELASQRGRQAVAKHLSKTSKFVG